MTTILIVVAAAAWRAYCRLFPPRQPARPLLPDWPCCSLRVLPPLPAPEILSFRVPPWTASIPNLAGSGTWAEAA